MTTSYLPHCISDSLDPAIKIGNNSGYEFAESYDLNAEPKHIVWTVKPGSESLREIRPQCVYDK